VEEPVAEGLALIAGAVFARVTDDRTTTPSGIKNISIHPSCFFVRTLKLSVWEEYGTDWKKVHSDRSLD
jgi:hypothetical protein